MQAVDRFQPSTAVRPTATGFAAAPLRAVDNTDVAIQTHRVPAGTSKRWLPGRARAVVIANGEGVVSVSGRRSRVAARDVLFVPAGQSLTVHPSRTGLDLAEVTPKTSRLPASGHLPFSPERVFQFEEGCAIHETFNRPSSPGLSLSLAFTPKGTLTADHALSCNEYQVVLSGEAEFEIEGRRFRARPGDVVVIPKDHYQRVRGLSDDPFTVMCVCLPRFDLSRYRERAGVNQPYSP